MACFLEYEIKANIKWLLVSVGIIFLALFFTFSRNALVCAIVLSLAYSLWVRRSALLLLAVGAVCLITAVSFLLEGETKEFLIDSRLGDVEKVQTFEGRSEIWEETIEYLKANPLVPVGYYGSVPAFGFSPHNWFLCTVVEMGPIGLVAGGAFFLSVAASCISYLKSRNEAMRRISRVGLIGVSVLFLNLQIEDLQFTSRISSRFGCISRSSSRFVNRLKSRLAGLTRIGQ